MTNIGRKWIFRNWEEYQKFLLEGKCVLLGIAEAYKREEGIPFALLVWNAYYEMALKNALAPPPWLNLEEIEKNLQVEVIRILHIQFLNLCLERRREITELKNCTDTLLKRIDKLRGFYDSSRFNERNEYSWRKIQNFHNVTAKKWGEDSRYLLSGFARYPEAIRIMRNIYEGANEAELKLKHSVLKEIDFPYIRIFLFEKLLEQEGINGVEKYSQNAIEEINSYMEKIIKDFLVVFLWFFCENLSNIPEYCCSDESIKVIEYELFKGTEKLAEIEKKILGVSYIKNANLSRGEQKKFASIMYL